MSMTLKQRVEALKVKDEVVRKCRAELVRHEGEFNEEFKSVLRALGLPEQFNLVDLLDKSLHHTEIKLA